MNQEVLFTSAAADTTGSTHFESADELPNCSVRCTENEPSHSTQGTIHACNRSEKDDGYHTGASSCDNLDVVQNNSNVNQNKSPEGLPIRDFSVSVGSFNTGFNSNDGDDGKDDHAIDSDVAPWVKQVRDDDGVGLLNALTSWLDEQRAGFRKLDRVFCDLSASEKSFSSNLAKLQKRKEVVAAVNIIGSTDHTGLLGALGHALRIVTFPGCSHDRQALAAGLQDLASRQSAVDAKFTSLRKRVQAVLSNSRSELSNSRSKVASLRLKLERCIRDADRAVTAARLAGSTIESPRAILPKPLSPPESSSASNGNIDSSAEELESTTRSQKYASEQKEESAKKAPEILKESSVTNIFASASTRSVIDKLTAKAESAITDCMATRKDYWNACHVLAQQRRQNLRVVLGLFGQFRHFFTNTLRAVLDSLRVAMKSTVVLVQSRTESLADAAATLDDYVDIRRAPSQGGTTYHSLSTPPASRNGGSPMPASSPVSSCRTLPNAFTNSTGSPAQTPRSNSLPGSPSHSPRCMSPVRCTPSVISNSLPARGNQIDVSIQDLLLPPTPAQVAAGMRIDESSGTASQNSDAAYRNAVESVEQHRIVFRALQYSLRQVVGLLDSQCKALTSVTGYVPDFVSYSGGSSAILKSVSSTSLGAMSTATEEALLGPAAALTRRLLRVVTKRSEWASDEKSHLGQHIVLSVEQILSDQRSDLRFCEDYYRQLTIPEASRPENVANFSPTQTASMILQMSSSLKQREDGRAQSILTRFAQAQRIALGKLRTLCGDLDECMANLPSLDAEEAFQSWVRSCAALVPEASHESILRRFKLASKRIRFQTQPSAGRSGTTPLEGSPLGSPRSDVSARTTSNLSDIFASDMDPLSSFVNIISARELLQLDALSEGETNPNLIESNSLVVPAARSEKNFGLSLLGDFDARAVIQDAENSVGSWTANICCQDVADRRKGRVRRQWAGPARYNGTLTVSGTNDILRFDRGDRVSLIALVGVTWCGFAPDGSYFDSLSHEYVWFEKADEPKVLKDRSSKLDGRSDTMTILDSVPTPQAGLYPCTLTTHLETFIDRFSNIPEAESNAKLRSALSTVTELQASFACMCTPPMEISQNCTDTIGRLYITDNVIAFWAPGADSLSLPTRVVFTGCDVTRVGRRLLTPGCVEIGLRHPENAVCAFFGFSFRDHAQECLTTFLNRHEAANALLEERQTEKAFADTSKSSKDDDLSGDCDEDETSSGIKVERATACIPYDTTHIQPLSVQNAGPRWRYVPSHDEKNVNEKDACEKKENPLTIESVFNALYGDFGEGSLTEALHACQDEFDFDPSPEPPLVPPLDIWKLNEERDAAAAPTISKRQLKFRRKVKPNPVAEKLVSLPQVCTSLRFSRNTKSNIAPSRALFMPKLYKV
jgi:hypothetical protein